MKDPSLLSITERHRPHHDMAEAYAHLCDEYECTALDLWSDGHPAIGAHTAEDYAVKFTRPRITAAGLPPGIATQLQHHLLTYALALPDDVLFYARRGGKATRLVGATAPRLYAALARSRPRLAPTGWPTRWQVGHTVDPASVDLIDRTEFLRIVHVSNLTVLEKE